MSPEMKGRIWIAVKTITFIICLAGFAWNSFTNFTQFIGKQTITTEDLQHNEELVLPSFTLCGISSFKEKVTNYQDLELNNYLNNTLELDEIFINVDGPVPMTHSIPANVTSIDLRQLKKMSTLWEVRTTFSQVRGRCHTIRYIPKVTKISNS